MKTNFKYSKLEIKKTILVIDTYNKSIEPLSDKLRNIGYEIFMCRNIQIAITVALRLIPTIIILPISIPDMAGIDLCMKLRKKTELQNTFITFLANSNEDSFEIVSFEVGADDFIKTPISFELLKYRLNAIIRRNNRES